MVVGAWIIIDEIPDFCQAAISWFQAKRHSFGPRPDATAMIPPATKIVLGLLLLGNQREIVRFIEQKSQSSPKE